MAEDFLQFVWEQRLFDADNLMTVSGEKLEVIETGTRNFRRRSRFFQCQNQD